MNLIFGRISCSFRKNFFSGARYYSQNQHGQQKTGSKWKIYWIDMMVKNTRPDPVSPQYRIVYRSSLETYANFSILATAVALVATPAMIIWNLMTISPETLKQRRIEMLLYPLAILATVGSMTFVSLRCPLRIYYSEAQNHFLAFMPRFVPYATRPLIIKPGEVQAPTKTSAYIPWNAIEYLHAPSKEKMILIDTSFSLPMYYNKLMGY